MDDVELIAEPTSEEQRVWEWRLSQLEGLGFKHWDAVFIASADDIDTLPLARRLIAAGCEHRLALKILG